MAINQKIWQISDRALPVKEVRLESEELLEALIEKGVAILNENWLIIGRQVITSFNKYIDLLAIDSNGSLIVVELKKDRTPREVVAQSLDYASWVKDLRPEELAEIYESYDKNYAKLGKSLDEAFQDKYGFKIDVESLNSTHQIVIVAAELDSSTERIVNYLNEYSIPVNVLFFKVFEESGTRFLSRAWMIDPNDAAESTSPRRTQEPWNGEYYVSFGDGQGRAWEDARTLGFISAGGGVWYTRTLNQLKPGDRVWVNIPRVGYVGVGRVSSPAKRADKVTFSKDGHHKTIFHLSTLAEYHKQYIDDDDNAEYIVKVEWEKAVTATHAISEVGFFGNQNSVCKPTTPKWPHTVDRLKEVWKVME